MRLHLSAAAAAAMSATLFAAPANALTQDVDLTFVIDRSGSMGGEFGFLGGAIAGFLADIETSPVVGTARGALVTYERSARLEQDLTDDPTVLQTAFGAVSVSGGRENAVQAERDAAFNLGIGYGADTVKSLILITDEDADDFFSADGADLRAELIGGGFLNNIIFRPGSGSSDTQYEQMAISSLSGNDPTEALFSITDFRDDPSGFLADFTAAKLREIEEEITENRIPLPGALPLAVLGVGALVGVARRRGKA